MTDITFRCAEEHYGVIAEPVPANRIIEDWYRKLSMEVPEYNNLKNFGHSVKACPPFLDAMTLGYMILMPVDFKIEVSLGGRQFEAGWRYPGPLVEGHSEMHIKGHPQQERAIAKIYTMWSITTPPGWSCMLFAPINRATLPIEAMSAVLDTDTLVQAISIPGFVNLPDGMHMVAKGTPLAQIVPFKREPINAIVRAETEAETKMRHKQDVLLVSEFGGYRKHVRAKDR